MKATKAVIVSGLAGLTVLGVHSGARAQQPEGPPPEAPPAQAAPPPPAYPNQGQYPPGYGPPPGYAPPPAYGAPPPRGYYYPPPPRRVYQPRYAYYPPPPPPPPPYNLERPFMLGGSLGLAGLHYHFSDGSTTSDPAAGYSVRLGFGLAPRLLFLIEASGAVSSVSIDGYGYSFDQTIYDLGVQAFLTRKLFVRGGVGLGYIRAWDDEGYYAGVSKTGFAMTGSVGLELLQGYNWSFELAGQAIAGFYRDENWTSYALNLGVNFF